MKLRKILYLGLASLMVAGVGATSTNAVTPTANAKRTHRSVRKGVKKNALKVTKNKAAKRSKAKAAKAAVKKPAVNVSEYNNNVKSHMRKPISYIKSSETIPYPKSLSARKDRIVVSLKNQRAYLMEGNKLLYEFYVSTGKNIPSRRTPKGHYRINGYRARSFYSPSEREGAYNAVGWKDWGLYLFHETPFNSHRKLIKSVARELGKKGTSYGCVHLSVRDSQWFYHHAPTGMRVIIK